MTQKKDKRRLFQFPWQYKEGFVISFILIILGLGFDFITKKPIHFPAFPTNLSLVITYTLLLIAIYKFEKNNKIVKWISGIPAAITATVLFTIVSAILGIVPQVEPGVILKDDILYDLGFKHLTTSWLIAFTYLFFVTSLGFATVKALIPFKKKKFGIFLSHLGLYIIFIAGIAGSSDAKRTYFYLENDAEPTNIVTDFYSPQKYETPFKLQLNKFDIIEYNPKIVLVNFSDNELITPNSSKHFIIKDSLSENFLDWTIKVEKFIKYSYPTDTSYSKFEETKSKGAIPAALVAIYDKQGNLINQEWITSGNFIFPRKNIAVNEKYYFAMLSPEPKEFSSDITAFLPDGTTENFILKVNKPKKLMGWDLYQTGYDERRGKWSSYSIIEAGYDPWLPAVFTGIFILIAGTFYLFWLGSRAIKEDDNNDNN
ncbi:MAG: hypothetical protein GXO49_07570 [Chlorobi bacterium]|nr:hypothetical protein [Chlorobiota bacterium]